MEKYGLIGKNVTYSYSKIIHEYIGELKGIKIKYDLISVADLSTFKFAKYQGLNVTIPYKNEVIKYLAASDELVDILQSCNTITNDLSGYNTDAKGFEFAIKRLVGDLSTIKRVVVLGNSNSAKMIKAVLKTAEVKICSRNPQGEMIGYDNQAEFYGDLIINTTPLTMANVSKTPVSKEILSNFRYGYDLNYNPSHNQFLTDLTELEIENDNGLLMLIMQAIYAFEIWHDLKLEHSEIEQVINYVEQIVWPKVAIIGMPYSGKTTLGKKYREMGKVVIDLDEEITKRYGAIDQLIISNGIEYFRKLETVVLAEIVVQKYDVLILGGGIIENIENYQLLNNHQVKWLNPPFSKIVRHMENAIDQSEVTRPLTSNVISLEQKKNEREIKYKIWSRNRQI